MKKKEKKKFMLEDFSANVLKKRKEAPRILNVTTYNFAFVF